MSDTAHTPLPYELIWQDGKHGIIGAATEKKLIAIVGNNPDDGLNDQRKANAEFIVRACNAHYEMLAALEDAKQLLDALRMDSGVGEILTDLQRELYAAIDAKVAAAIAKGQAE